MNDFYQDRHNFYQNSYWNIQRKNILIPNGFTVYPNKEYNYFVSIIDNLNKKAKCTIIDICCGNGLLLKHLIENCHSQIIPYGIDFLDKSINQAKTVLHQNFSNNFFVSNAINFDFSEHFFDFVLIDPYHFEDKDLKRLLQILIEQTSNCIVFYTYADILMQNKFKSVVCFPALIGIKGLQTHNYKEISIAVLNCKE
jgi:SAM-dependent methyltransferase